MKTIVVKLADGSELRIDDVLLYGVDHGKLVVKYILPATKNLPLQFHTVKEFKREDYKSFKVL